MSGKNAIFGRLSTYFFSRSSIVALLFAMSLFSLFINIKPFNSRPINQTAACTFGVYLIHDNSIMRNLLWIKIFKNADYAMSEYLILHLIVTVTAIYTCCTIIEFMRKTVFKWLAGRTDAHIDAFQKKLEDKISVFSQPKG